MLLPIKSFINMQYQKLWGLHLLNLIHMNLKILTQHLLSLSIKVNGMCFLVIKVWILCVESRNEFASEVIAPFFKWSNQSINYDNAGMIGIKYKVDKVVTILFKYIKNKTGPIIYPWGAPSVTDNETDKPEVFALLHSEGSHIADAERDRIGYTSEADHDKLCFQTSLFGYHDRHNHLVGTLSIDQLIFLQENWSISNLSKIPT